MNRPTVPLVLACGLWAAAAAGGNAADEDMDARLLAGSCYGCHAASSDQRGAMGDLSHLSVEAVAAALKHYRQRSRRATVMGRIASGYSDDEIEQLASHFGRASP